jgi:DNA-binding NarL/FixJ family response regulator
VFRRENPSAEILFLSVYESAQTLREVINAGAQGYVAKSRAGHDLVDEVRNVLDGETFFPTLARSARRATRFCRPQRFLYSQHYV